MRNIVNWLNSIAKGLAPIGERPRHIEPNIGDEMVLAGASDPDDARKHALSPQQDFQDRNSISPSQYNRRMLESIEREDFELDAALAEFHDQGREYAGPTPEEEEAFAEVSDGYELEERARRAQADFDDHWEIDSDGHFHEREWRSYDDFDDQISISSSQFNREMLDAIDRENLELDAVIAEFHEQGRERNELTPEEEEAFAAVEQTAPVGSTSPPFKHGAISPEIAKTKRLRTGRTSRSPDAETPDSQALQPIAGRNDRGPNKEVPGLSRVDRALMSATTPKQPGVHDRKATSVPGPSSCGGRPASANLAQQESGGLTTSAAGTYGRKEDERRRLTQEFGDGISAAQYEAEHIVPFAVHGLPRDKTSDARKLADSMPAYYETLHRDHPGTENRIQPFETAWPTPKSYFTDQENALEDKGASLLGTTASNCYQLNQLGYAYVIAGKRAGVGMSRELETRVSISTDSYRSVVDSDPTVNYRDYTVNDRDSTVEYEEREFHLGPVGQAEAYLARQAAVTGRWPSPDDISEALARYSGNLKEQQNNSFEGERHTSRYDERSRETRGR